MVRNLAVWLVALTVAGMMMAMVLAGAAHAERTVAKMPAVPGVEKSAS